jgi:predicted GNAT family acetyltransferase
MLKSSLKPTEKHLNQIKNWLIEEWNKTNNGFYCNWEMIEKSFDEKRLSVLTYNDNAVGFVVYKICKLVAVIEITEIKPSERKKGYAKKLIIATLEYFKSKKILVVHLFCSPENSEPFWRKIGFLNYPDILNYYRINMYITLIDTLEFSKIKNGKSEIKLWNLRPGLVKGKQPNWVWSLSFLDDNKTLSKPIIFPISLDWKIELTKTNGNIKSDEIKHCEIDFEYDCGFIIIKKIND